jgi:hypothetical protein|tara:strand:+ start:2859 stop:3488 length:630 start_codon:yes stop_codon:yes gene_type:complete
MALDSYANLKTEIANYLNRTDLTSYLDTFIELAESRIARDLRLREMETIDTSITTVSGTQSYDLPTGYLEMRYVAYQTSPYTFLTFLAPPDFMRVYNAGEGSGTPSHYTIIGSKIYLGMQPDAAKVLELGFFKRPTGLSAVNTTNEILTNFPDIYLYSCLAESEPFLMNDERLQVWASLYKEAVETANNSAQRGRSSGAPLNMTARMVV